MMYQEHLVTGVLRAHSVLDTALLIKASFEEQDLKIKA